MCTRISSSLGGNEAPRRRGPCAGAGTRAAGLGDAGAALVDAHRDGVWLRAGLDDLEVDVGTIAPEREEVDDGDVLDADDGVRVADAEMADRAERVGADAVPIVAARRCRQPRPCRRRPRSRRDLSVGVNVTRRSPASVRIRCGSRSPRRRASAWAKQRMPLPLISAREPSALYSTIRAAYPGSVSPTSSPSAPMPRRRSHTRRARAAQIVDVAGGTTTRKSLPSPWCLVSSRSAIRFPVPASTSATGSSSTSIQRMRGSRRNHRSWRTANWRVRVMVAAMAASSVHARRGGRAAPCSRAPGGRFATTGPRGKRFDLGDQAGVDHPMDTLGDAPGQQRPRPAQPELVEAEPAGTCRRPGRTS